MAFAKSLSIWDFLPAPAAGRRVYVTAHYNTV